MNILCLCAIFAVCFASTEAWTRTLVSDPAFSFVATAAELYRIDTAHTTLSRHVSNGSWPVVRQNTYFDQVALEITTNGPLRVWVKITVLGLPQVGYLSGSSFVQLLSASVTLLGNGVDNMWALYPNGAISRSLAGSPFISIPNAPVSFYKIVATENLLYGISANKQSIWRYYVTDGGWSQLGSGPGVFTDIAAAYGKVFVVSDCNIWEWGGPSGWLLRGTQDNVAQVAISLDGVFVLDANQQISVYSYGTSTWSPVSGFSYTSLIGQGDRLYALGDSTTGAPGYLWRMNP